MAKEIVLEIDGKKIALTPEQIKVLGLEEKTTQFTRSTGKYFYIGDASGICRSTDNDFVVDVARHRIANYCTDESLIRQRALHETLNRLLWRFSMENDGDKIDWNDTLKAKCLIYFDRDRKSIRIHQYYYMDFEGAVFFYSEEIAQRAINEIVLPFMKEHSDFIW